MVLLFATHYFWKLVVDADLHSQQIAIFGIDMTTQFHAISRFTAKMVHGFVCLFPDTQNFVNQDTLIYFTDGKIKLNIIWGCTGIKQLYIFITIMLLYKGPLMKKLWYIPLGCLILQAYNIIRIGALAFLTKEHPERFDFLHEGLFRYIYYGLIFLLWVIWEEKISSNTKNYKLEDKEDKKDVVTITPQI